MPEEAKWQSYLTSEEAWDAMYKALENAREEIKFEQFIFLDDSIGKRFAELFKRKVKEGVKVYLLADCGGSYSFYNSDLAEELEKAGVKVLFFNKISPWRLANLRIWFFRDHRKILITDNKEAFIGGVGVGEPLKGWRDTHVRIVGDVVEDIRISFDRIWEHAEKEHFLPFKEPRQLPSGFSLLTNAPHFHQRFIYRSFLAAIRSATKYVYITTPYFVPDTRMFRVLRLAVRRGVDVRILLPSESDHPYVDWASHFHFSKALRSGIRIWNYNKMLHSKSIAVDDSWASVGSSNMDNYSFFFNYEANLVSVKPKFAEEVRGQFLLDLEKAVELTLPVWQKRGLHQKILEFLFTPLAKFL